MDWAEAGRLSTVLVIGFVLGSALTFVGLVSWILNPGMERGSTDLRIDRSKLVDAVQSDLRAQEERELQA